MVYLIFDTQNCKRREKEKSHECHNTKEQNTNNEKYIHKKNEQKQINKKRQSVLFSSFFFFVYLVRFFLLKTKCHWEKSSWAEKVAYRISCIFQRSSVSFLGSSGIYSSCRRFTQVVGEATHFAEENKIGVGWVKVKKLPILQVGKWKSVLIVLLEKNSTLFGILRPFWIVLEDSSAGTFENFSQCFAGFFLSRWNDACS